MGFLKRRRAFLMNTLKGGDLLHRQQEPDDRNTSVSSRALGTDRKLNIAKSTFCA